MYGNLANNFLVFVLLNVSERPKRRFSCFWTFQKGQMEDFHASEHFRKSKWRFFMLLNVSERANGGFSCFWTFQKEQKEVFRASERFRKSKWRIFVLLNVSERANGEFLCFWTFQKEQMEKNNRFCQRHKREKEKIIASVNDISMKKRK